MANCAMHILRAICQRGSTMRHVLTAILVALLAVPAAADEWRAEANPFDLERLDNNDATLEKALEAAYAGGEDADIAAVRELTGPSQPIEGEALLGDWKCRTIKLGGRYLPLIVYGWFKCRISIAEHGLFFEKLTGSQRTAGYLRPVYPEDGELPLRYIYLGSSFVRGESPAAYGGPDNRLGRVSENHDDPAILEALGSDRLRMGFPLPVVESDYDFLELRR